MVKNNNNNLQIIFIYYIFIKSRIYFFVIYNLPVMYIKTKFIKYKILSAVFYNKLHFILKLFNYKMPLIIVSYLASFN